MAISKLTSPVTQNDAINKINEIIGETDYETDSEPYLLRAAPYGGVEVDEIIGGTVAWNQIAKELTSANYTAANATATYSNGEVTMTNTGYNGRIYQAVTMAANHKYLLSAESINTDSIPAYCYADALDYYSTGFALPQSSAYVRTAKVINSAGRTPAYILIRNNSKAGTVKVKNLMLIDLTALFGSTIADYIYAQEQATAGAGVAIFRKMFAESYYPYNSGELISVSGLSAHEMVGFNQWDEDYALGFWNANGIFSANTSGYMSNKTHIRVLSNTSYCFTCTRQNGVSFYLCYYDADKNFISRSTIAYQNRLFTTPSNCHYICFSTYADYGTTYNHNICISISQSKTDIYEPYQKHTYPLDSSLTLRGIPKLANGKMYFDGDVYASDGTVTRKYGIVDLGTLNWVLYVTGGKRTFNTNDIDIPAKSVAIMSSKYTYKTAVYISVQEEKTFETFGAPKLSICDTSFTEDASAFKAAMSGVYLVYELATATTETAEPFTNPQIVSEYGTEEYVSATICPVGHNTKYISGYGLTQHEAIITSLIDSSPITSYDAGTEALLTAGTDTSNRVWQAKILHDYVTDAVAEAGGASPSTSVPLMDGTGAVGTSNLYARGDHVHPSDTAKADKTSTVTNVAYDSTNKKLTKTINGTTSDVVTVATLKTDMSLSKSDVGLGNVTNVEQAPKSTAVTNVAWDTTNHKLTKTINGTTSDISILPGLLNRGTITAFNDATTTGFYIYTSSATNRPPVSAGGCCLVLYISSSSCWQLAFITSTSSTAMQAYARRMYSSGNWTAWKAFTFAS